MSIKGGGIYLRFVSWDGWKFYIGFCGKNGEVMGLMICKNLKFICVLVISNIKRSYLIMLVILIVVEDILSYSYFNVILYI